MLTGVFVLQHTNLCMCTWESHWDYVSHKEVQADSPPPRRLGLPVLEHSGFLPVYIASEKILPGIKYPMPRAKTLLHAAGPDVHSATNTKIAKSAVPSVQKPRAKQYLPTVSTSADETVADTTLAVCCDKSAAKEEDKG